MPSVTKLANKFEQTFTTHKPINLRINLNTLGKDKKTESIEIQQSVPTSRFASNVGVQNTLKNESKKDIEVTTTKPRTRTQENSMTASFDIKKSSTEKSDTPASKTIVLDTKKETVLELKTNISGPENTRKSRSFSTESTKSVSTIEETKKEENKDEKNSSYKSIEAKTEDQKQETRKSKLFENKFKTTDQENNENAAGKRRPVSMANISSNFENNKFEKRPLSAVVENTFEKKPGKLINNETQNKKKFTREETKKPNDFPSTQKPELNKVNLRKTNETSKSTARPKSLNDFKSKFESKPPQSDVNNRRSLHIGNNRSKFETDNKSFNVNLRSTDSTTNKETSPVKKEVGNVKDVKPETQNEKSQQSDIKEKPATSTETNQKEETIASNENKETTGKELTIGVKKSDQTSTITEKNTTTKESIPGGTRTVEKSEKVETVGNLTVKRTQTKMTEVKQTSSPASRKIETKVGQQINNNVNVPLKLNLRSGTKSVSIEDKLKDQKKNTRTSNTTKGQNMFKLQISAEAASKPANNPLESKANSNIDKLLKWIAKRINYYPCVKVSNFTTSWEDGIALCALMHHLLGEEAITPTDVSSTDKLKNFEMAVKAATDAGVPPLIEAHELANGIDRRSMITYLHTIYKVLVADKKQ